VDCLTLKHPWPWAIAERGKRIENRKWRPERDQIGVWTALHGGVSPSNGKPYWEALADLQTIIGKGLSPMVNLGPLIKPYCGIFAVCRFGEPFQRSDSPWFTGPWGWPILDLVVLPEPVPIRGQLGLWELPEGTLEQVRIQYRLTMTHSTCPVGSRSGDG
jgi:hypothetical protein